MGTIRLLVRADTSTGTVAEVQRGTLPMLKLHLVVMDQDGSGLTQPHELPPVWMELSAAALLAEGLSAKIAHLLGQPTPTQPNGPIQ